MRKERGLTLIELAVVLIVLGILLGVGAGIVGALIKRVKYNESKEIVNAAVDGIVGYATSSGRLPANDTELRQAVRSLKDSYGKKLMYIYDQDLTASSPYGLCGLTSTNLTVRVCEDATCGTVIQTVNNVAFLVISGNGNYNIQTWNSSLSVVSSADVIVARASNPTTINVYEFGTNVDNYPTDINRVEPYDDIVMWVTLHELQTAQGCEALVITSPTTLPEATEDEPYSYQLTARGGRPPYTWSGSIGSGLTLNPDGTITGTVNVNTSTSTGELPGCTASISFSATVQDGAGQTLTQNFTIPVRARNVEIITDSLPDALEGTAYSADVDAIGGSGTYTFSVATGSSLPSWLSLDPSTGVLSGTPPTDAGCSEGLENFSLVATSCARSYTAGFSIRVRDPDCGGGGGGSGGCPAMFLTPTSGTTFNATVGTYFSQTIFVSGGQPPITNTLCSPSTPCNGLAITCSGTSATISGTPTAPGTCTFNVAFQDSCSTPQTVNGTYSVVIGCSPLTGFADTLSNGQVCEPYSGTITALGGGSPYSWLMTSGSLPYGVNFCTGNTTATCTISGGDIIDYPGTYNFTVQVQDVCGQILSQPFQITVTSGTVDTNCITNGIDVDEDVSGNLYFTDTTGTPCSRIRNSTRFYLGRTYTIYRDNNCTQQLCTLNFCQLWDVEWANNFSNCRVEIVDLNCTLNDN
jgi:prepilin-type N-terminal cleavage/methylation domain-containing protein